MDSQQLDPAALANELKKQDEVCIHINYAFSLLVG